MQLLHQQQCRPTTGQTTYAENISADNQTLSSIKIAARQLIDNSSARKSIHLDQARTLHLAQIGSPFVSGTLIKEKNRATTEMAKNMRNVQEDSKACVKVRTDCGTMRFEIQFAVAAIPPQMPRYIRDISGLKIPGTIPIPGEKNMMQNVINPTSASHPMFLGHPLVNHFLSSPWHKPWTAPFGTKHTPGNSCNNNNNDPRIIMTMVRTKKSKVWNLFNSLSSWFRTL